MNEVSAQRLRLKKHNQNNMKLADKIKEKLLRWVVVSGYDIAIPNFFVDSYEMDVFMLKSTGYIYEYEIKISRSDFKADFNKKRCYKSDTKHVEISAGKRSCNRFYFVVPEGLITIDECPKYAGLIYYTDYGDNYNDRILSTVKAAPVIHKNKGSLNYAEIARRLALREQHWSKKYRMERRKQEKEKSNKHF